MKCDNVKELVVFSIPKGFSIRFYHPGDEQDWAKIQVSVGEFENESAALKCFEHYLAYEEELTKRQLYVIDDQKGIVVASYMMKCFYDLMPNCEVWLDTQTWSYNAIGIYMDLDFIPMKFEIFNNVSNQYHDACKVIKRKNAY